MTFFLHTLAILPGNKIHLSNQRPKPANWTALRRLSPISVSLLAAWLGGTAKASVGSWTRWHSSSGRVQHPPWHLFWREGKAGFFVENIILGGLKVTWEKMLVLKKRRGEVFWFWSGFCMETFRMTHGVKLWSCRYQSSCYSSLFVNISIWVLTVLANPALKTSKHNRYRLYWNFCIKHSERINVIYNFNMYSIDIIFVVAALTVYLVWSLYESTYHKIIKRIFEKRQAFPNQCGISTRKQRTPHSSWICLMAEKISSSLQHLVVPIAWPTWNLNQEILYMFWEDSFWWANCPSQIGWKCFEYLRILEFKEKCVS